ncbi:MAG: hypothetical protein N3E51_00765 [Candidatus Micrarchaeota archaeon]|nr:hypothetical protein [Candidatus Micrarchaeota archaeon]
MASEEEEGEDIQKLYQERIRQAQLEAKKKELLRRLLSSEAYERMMNVRISSPEVYEKALSSLAYFAQQHGFGQKISDEQLYALLRRLTQEPQTRIEFRRK